ncbi:DUF2306 domain-containing protein [Dactylosporangium sp. NPDC051541]|uniref:DUF2306 domain-containing protein n=1 Tax=Dactylosporangium sp. NPDC051541 TaxID=3363977 RepID=UPI0037A9F2B8
MSDNVVIPLHAAAATISLLLGAFNLLRRTRGDRLHKVAGRVWVGAMYFTIISSFFIQALKPGHFSWIHGLSAFTFVTLSVGLWAAIAGRIEHHRRFMTGSYLGLLGAFVGAVVVPQRDIPQWIVHRPIELVLGFVACAAVVALVILAGRRGTPVTESRQGEHIR